MRWTHERLRLLGFLVLLFLFLFDWLRRRRRFCEYLIRVRESVAAQQISGLGWFWLFHGAYWLDDRR
jgi:hypothetical protein